MLVIEIPIKKKIDKNFFSVYEQLNFKNKILWFLDKEKYKISKYLGMSVNDFHFIDDEHYIEEMKIDYENYKYYTELEGILDDGDSKKQAHYERFPESDKRIPDKFKPFFAHIDMPYTYWLYQKMPASVSMKKDLINAMFIYTRRMIHKRKRSFLYSIYYIEKYGRGSDFNPFHRYMKTKEICQTYENIIHNNITKF